MKLSLLVINFHSAELTASAISSARSAAVAEIEAVIVDNSLNPAEAERLRGLDAGRLIVAESNLGYAAGINRGLEACTGDVVIVSNPDVTFGEDSIDALVAALGDPEVGVAGPSFFWDERFEWHLPPAETMRFGEQLWIQLGSWIPPLRSRLNQRRLDRRIRFWNATSPLDVDVLSGAVMAFRTKLLRTIRFDERYPLYFEEVDLMRRLARAGKTARYVPSARVRHAWAQSAVRNPDVAEMFELSRRTFQRRWYGNVRASILEAISRPRRRECNAPELVGETIDVSHDGEYLVELGDGPDFQMAAGRFFAGRAVDLPVESMRQSPLEQFCCRVIDLTDKSVLQCWTVPRHPSFITPPSLQ